MNLTGRKRTAMIVAGIVAIYLVYRWQQSRSTPPASDQGAAGDTSGQAAYSQLAGQEQADIAALQNAEQNDISGLGSQLNALVAQEGSDYSTATENQQAVNDAINQVAAGQVTLSDALAGLAKGAPHQVAVHAGGPFARFYTAVTGRKAPRTISSGDFFYQAWREGFHASQLKGDVNHNQHPSKNNGSVAPAHHGMKPGKAGQPHHATHHQPDATGTHTSTRASSHPSSTAHRPAAKAKVKTKPRRSSSHKTRRR